MRLLFFAILISFSSFAQEWPPEDYSPEAWQPEDQEIYLDWADSLLPLIETIEFVQLHPWCENEDQRKRLYAGKKRKKNDRPCWDETVLVPDSLGWDTISLTSGTVMLEEEILSVKIDTERLYNYTQIDTADFQSIFEASLGLREARIRTMCYNPRHAIVFKDENMEILGICELCFECGQSKLYFTNLVHLEFAPQDEKVLHALFIKYGLIEEKED